MIVSILGSGSTGNAIYCRLNDKDILIDAGLSYQQIKKRLELIDKKCEDIDFILISHEHQDHIRGLFPFINKHNIRFYISRKCMNTIRHKFADDEPNAEFFSCGTVISGDGFKINCMSIPHDSADNYSFYLRDDSGSMLVVYDTGEIPDNIINKYQDVNILVIESNHDTEMLFGSSYPWHLKKRIMSLSGHLSNEQSLHYTKKLVERKVDLKYLVPFHLSKENNHPDLVKMSFSEQFLRDNKIELVESFSDAPSRLIKL